MIYISFGFAKSGSTFTFEVSEAIFRAAGLELVTLSTAAKGNGLPLNYVELINWPAIERIRAELKDGSVVLKTHGPPDEMLLEAVDRGEIFASAVIRDPRDMALSLLDHARRSRARGSDDFAQYVSFTDTFILLDQSFGRLDRWLKSSKVLLLTYDEVAFDTASAVQRIIDQLALPISAADVQSHLPDPTMVQQFNKGVPQRYEAEMPLEVQNQFLKRYGAAYEKALARAAIR